MEPLTKDRSRATAEPAPAGLRMAPEHLLDLARQAAELLVDRFEGLPETAVWEGDFRPRWPTGWPGIRPRRGRPRRRS